MERLHYWLHSQFYPCFAADEKGMWWAPTDTNRDPRDNHLLADRTDISDSAKAARGGEAKFFHTVTSNKGSWTKLSRHLDISPCLAFPDGLQRVLLCWWCMLQQKVHQQWRCHGPEGPELAYEVHKTQQPKALAEVPCWIQGLARHTSPEQLGFLLWLSQSTRWKSQ